MPFFVNSFVGVLVRLLRVRVQGNTDGEVMPPSLFSIEQRLLRYLWPGFECSPRFFRVVVHH
jgi:hypothetical protein